MNQNLWNTRFVWGCMMSIHPFNHLQEILLWTEGTGPAAHLFAEDNDSFEEVLNFLAGKETGGPSQCRCGTSMQGCINPGEQVGAAKMPLRKVPRFPGTGSNRFPSKVPRKRFPSKVPRKRFPSRYLRRCSQARLGCQELLASTVPKNGSQGSRNSCQARFPRKLGSQEQVSKKRLQE